MSEILFWGVGSEPLTKYQMFQYICEQASQKHLYSCPKGDISERTKPIAVIVYIVIGFIIKYLTRLATEKLVHALISSLLWILGMYYHKPSCSDCMQKAIIENAAARITTTS